MGLSLCVGVGASGVGLLVSLLPLVGGWTVACSSRTLGFLGTGGGT